MTLFNSPVRDELTMFWQGSSFNAKLMHRARERLVRLAKQHGLSLRQSYARVGKTADIQHQHRGGVGRRS
jgi:hypothetical protein